jgi:RNA polymerase sigma factor (sigma-70 family)
LAGSALLGTQTDARLVDLVRAGNDRAFEAIVIRYRRSLLRHCRRLLPAGRAEDAVQQTFLRALEAMRADRRELQLAAWLHRIAHNAAIDALRLDSDWEELDERIDGVEPTHAAVERRARFRSVVATVGSLPERQRRALVLRELEGRTYEDIAETLGVSGDAVRQLLNRARNAMRAGVGALVPPVLVARLASNPAAVRAAELADPPGSSAVFAKAAAAVAAGSVALLALTAPGDRLLSPNGHAGAGPPALQSRADAGGRSADGTTAVRAHVEGGRSASARRQRRHAGEPGRGRADAHQLGRNPAGPGEGDATERPDEGDAPGGSRGDDAVGDRSDADDGAVAGGGDAFDDDGAGADEGPDDDVLVLGTTAPVDDDGDAAAPSGSQVAESPDGGDEDDYDTDALD